MTQPFFPCTISAQSRNNEFLTIKTVVRKTHQNNGHTGSSCLDKAMLAQGGGGTWEAAMSHLGDNPVRTLCSRNSGTTLMHPPPPHRPSLSGRIQGLRLGLVRHACCGLHVDACLDLGRMSPQKNGRFFTKH